MYRFGRLHHIVPDQNKTNRTGPVEMKIAVSAPLFHIKCNSVSHQAVVIYITTNTL